jgi:hypothetical protein
MAAIQEFQAHKAKLFYTLDAGRRKRIHFPCCSARNRRINISFARYTKMRVGFSISFLWRNISETAHLVSKKESH